MSDNYEVETILVPVDGSEAALEAVEYAITIAKQYTASLHVLSVLSPSTAESTALADAEDNEIADHVTEFADIVREYTPDSMSTTFSSVYGFSTTELSRHPGSVILDVADDTTIDFIVPPREPVIGESDELLSLAAEYVLEYATQPVLSV